MHDVKRLIFYILTVIYSGTRKNSAARRRIEALSVAVVSGVNVIMNL